MSRAVLLPLLALVLATPAHGEPRAAVGGGARKALALTIYGQDLAVVRETRAVTLPAGESVLRFVDVPDQLDARTVSLRSLAEPAAVAVRQQTLRWDLASTDTLLQRYVGREVDLVETSDRLRDRVTRAALLSPQGPLFQIGDQLSVGHPGRVSLPPIEPALYTTPTLEWLVTNSGAEAQDVEVRYSTSGLSWTADYVLALAPDAASASLTAWITIVNQSAVRWADARLALLAGTVRTVQEARPMFARSVAMAAMDAEAMPKAPEQVLDYQRYALPRPTTIEPSVTTQVPLLEAADVPVQKQYRVESTPPWQHQAAPGDDGQTLPVTVAFELTNDAESHLGVPLPSGVVRVYAAVDGGGAELAGEARIAHVAPDEELLVTVGEANDVVARRKQTDFRKLDTKPWQVESAFEVTLRNHRKDDVVVAVREHLAGQWEVVQSSLEGRRIDADTLGFEVPVPAGGETVLRYTVKIGG
jgi:hypothetical protein